MDTTGRAAKSLKSHADKGTSAYGCVDGQSVVDLPYGCFEGRVGNLGKTFSGYFDLEKEEMRVNCAEEPTFWLEIKMGKAPFNDLRPDGDTAKNLKRHFTELSAGPDLISEDLGVEFTASPELDYDTVFENVVNASGTHSEPVMESVYLKVCGALGLVAQHHFDSLKKMLAVTGPFGAREAIFTFADFFSDGTHDSVAECSMFQFDTATESEIVQYVREKWDVAEKLPMVAYLLATRDDIEPLFDHLNHGLDRALGCCRYDFPVNLDRAKLLLRLGASVDAEIRHVIDEGRKDVTSYTVRERLSEEAVARWSSTSADEIYAKSMYAKFTEVRVEIEKYLAEINGSNVKAETYRASGGLE